MHHTSSLVDYIESAIDRSPFCACGAGMTAVEHDGSLWLECVRHDEDRRGSGTGSGSDGSGAGGSSSGGAGDGPGSEA